MIQLKDIKPKSIFTELSSYIVDSVTGTKVHMTHLETLKPISVDFTYLRDIMVSGDHFDTIEYVTKDDRYFTAKQVEDLIKEGKFKNENELPVAGTLKSKGIRTIFSEIPFKHCFTVEFRKVGKTLSEKQIATLKAKQINELLSRIEVVQKQKKGILASAKEALVELQNNVIESYIPGDLRVLRGIKLSTHSDTGFYVCKDLDFPDGDMNDITKNTRLVNINSIESLILNGVKYQIEK